MIPENCGAYQVYIYIYIFFPHPINRGKESLLIYCRCSETLICNTYAEYQGMFVAVSS